ncbi:MAG: DEAD-box ATP-dependent RNA helicase DeaD [Cytophagales bacterium]|nr:DEAD/DEAH box helicase [Bacteroidota bacterium]MBS1981654.1 DEAD/DEAH box helicase [Bacteroidota bacterium]WHZ08964.1 MAG: DEAD-box ATP-dependent RNA helicase DeaD [Cytophagales bacterium]
MTFQDFHFNHKLQDGLNAMGYKNPTPIQEQAIPLILAKRDLIACAQTGTGKTAAYLLPILNNIIHSDHRHLNTLIIAPTRELVQQIDQQVEGFAYFTGVSSIPIYGGGDGAVWDQQKKALEAGVDLMIATPGRLIAQLASGVIDLKHVQHLVLDEADRMLDMGFHDDIIRIIKYLPPSRQTLLFSATMPQRIRTLANRILREPVEVTIAISRPADGIVQEAYLVNDDQKEKLITHLLKGSNFSSALIFASTKEKVKHLGRLLPKLGLPSKAIHSDLEQSEREEILREFKNKQLNLLIGTDVLSRGIDVEGIELVLNYDVPPDPEDYIHRIGRTARAASTGHAITFINQFDQRRFGQIESLIGCEISKANLPEGFQSSFVYNPYSKQRPDKPRNTHARNSNSNKRFFKKRS